MKKKRKLKKKPLIFLGTLLVLGLAAGTFAYYYSQSILVRNFKAMTYKVSIEEEFYGDFGTKKVSFVNLDEKNVPVILRIMYNESWTRTLEENGEIIELHNDNDPNGKESVKKEWTDDFMNHFIDMGDGWYYYDRVLKPEESVHILESIDLDEDAINYEYEDYTYNLDFNMEAIQATTTALQEIWGKDATILDDGTIDFDWGDPA